MGMANYHDCKPLMNLFSVDLPFKKFRCAGKYQPSAVCYGWKTIIIFLLWEAH